MLPEAGGIWYNQSKRNGVIGMFRKGEEGAGRVLWPFCAGAAVVCGALGYVYHWGFWMFAAMFVCWTVTLLVAWLLFVWLLSLTVDLAKPVPEDHPAIRRIVNRVIGLLCLAGRLRIRVKGLEKLPEGRFLLVGNHRSNYDPTATVWALHRHGREIAFVTKPENMKIPLVRLIHRANYLVIDREDPRKAIATIHAAADLLAGDVVNVGIYPEGTRSKGTEMLPFHNAVFKIAKRADAPMVVAYITGTERIHGNAPWRRTDVTLDLCAVISREEVAASSTKALGDRVRDLLEQSAGKS